MSILSNLNPISAISTAIFGQKGIAGGVMDVLKESGVIKAKLTPEEQAQIEQNIRQWELDKMDKDNAVIQAVNQTMQSEAKSEHWLQWAWRPIFGLTACGILIWNYIAAPLFHYPILVIPNDVWTMLLAVLGIAAGTRGYEKIVAAKNDSES